MADFDEKLNSLLSNPDAMSQIMQLAQSLGNENQASDSTSAPSQAGAAAEGPATVQPTQEHVRPSSSPSSTIDPALLSRFLPLIQELGGQQDSNARQLIYALRPYLKAERQEKVERALQLARLFHIGKQFLAGWEGRGHV